MDDDAVFGGESLYLRYGAQEGSRHAEGIGTIVLGIVQRGEGEVCGLPLLVFLAMGWWLWFRRRCEVYAGTEMPVSLDGFLQDRVVGGERRASQGVGDEGHMCVALSHPHVDAHFRIGSVNFEHGGGVLRVVIPALPAAGGREPCGSGGRGN